MRKQADYLAALLADEPAAAEPVRTDAGEQTGERRPRATTLLDRESALARVAGGEVRQVTQLLLDPARVRPWSGNARAYQLLDEANCRELLDSIIAEGGQKVPAVVRRVANDPAHDYEVIAGTRRHWSITWLRAHSYPDLRFLAQVATLDDEAAFRLADLENRARADVSDLERARNYRDALDRHYGGYQTRMAERLRVSKGWLSKMLKVAALPDAVIAAFASAAELRLKPAYALAGAMDDRHAVRGVLAKAAQIAREQAAQREAGAPPLLTAEVMRRLLDAAAPSGDAPDPYRYVTRHGRTVLSVQSSNRQGVTLRLHAGSGADTDELIAALRDALTHLEATGRGLQR